MPDLREYYVTALYGKQVAWLVGPFHRHADALGAVRQANTIACQLDPRCAFAAFGTTLVVNGTGVPGRLNAHFHLPVS